MCGLSTKYQREGFRLKTAIGYRFIFLSTRKEHDLNLVTLSSCQPRQRRRDQPSMLMEKSQWNFNADIMKERRNKNNEQGT